MSAQGQIGVRIQVDGGFGAWLECDAIGLADGATDSHLLGIEDARQGLPGIQLIAFLRFALRVGPKDILNCHHSGKDGVNFETGDVPLRSVECDLLAIALKLEDAESGSIRLILGCVRYFETVDMFL